MSNERSKTYAPDLRSPAEEPDGGTTPATQRPRHRLPRDSTFLAGVVAAVVALIVSVLGAGVSVITTRETLQAQLDSQRAQLDDQHAAADREHRATVYKAFLDATYSYQLATDTMMNWLKSHRAEFEFDGHTVNLPPEFSKLVNRWLDKRSAFQGKVNDVYIYGSATAWSAASRLAGALPPATGKLVIRDVTYPDFNNRYNDFLAVMCRELPAQPRGSC